MCYKQGGIQQSHWCHHCWLLGNEKYLFQQLVLPVISCSLELKEPQKGTWMLKLALDFNSIIILHVRRKCLHSFWKRNQTNLCFCLSGFSLLLNWEDLLNPCTVTVTLCHHSCQIWIILWKLDEFVRVILKLRHGESTSRCISIIYCTWRKIHYSSCLIRSIMYSQKSTRVIRFLSDTEPEADFSHIFGKIAPAIFSMDWELCLLFMTV